MKKKKRNSDEGGEGGCDGLLRFCWLKKEKKMRNDGVKCGCLWCRGDDGELKIRWLWELKNFKPGKGATV